MLNKQIISGVLEKMSSGLLGKYQWSVLLSLSNIKCVLNPAG